MCCDQEKTKKIKQNKILEYVFSYNCALLCPTLMHVRHWDPKWVPCWQWSSLAKSYQLLGLALANLNSKCVFCPWWHMAPLTLSTLQVWLHFLHILFNKLTWCTIENWPTHSSKHLVTFLPPHYIIDYYIGD